MGETVMQLGASESSGATEPTESTKQGEPVKLVGAGAGAGARAAARPAGVTVVRAGEAVTVSRGFGTLPRWHLVTLITTLAVIVVIAAVAVLMEQGAFLWTVIAFATVIAVRFVAERLLPARQVAFTLSREGVTVETGHLEFWKKADVVRLGAGEVTGFALVPRRTLAGVPRVRVAVRRGAGLVVPVDMLNRDVRWLVEALNVEAARLGFGASEAGDDGSRAGGAGAVSQDGGAR